MKIAYPKFHMGASLVLAALLFGACGDDESGSDGGPDNSGGDGGSAIGGEGGSSAGGDGGGSDPGGSAGSGGSGGQSDGGTGGGASGSGGSSDGGGGAGGGGGAPVEDLCGNGDVDDGEECDDGNEVDGDGCSSYCTSSCEACWEANCPAEMDACFEMAGDAQTGLAAGFPLKDLCAETVRCFWENDCARYDVAECYCGSFEDVTLDACLQGEAAGPCKDKFEYAAESSDPLDISLRIDQTQYALGAAGLLNTCSTYLCPDVCFPGGSGADGGAAP